MFFWKKHNPLSQTKAADAGNEILKLSIKEIVVSKNIDKNIHLTLQKVYGILVSICEDVEIENYLESLFESVLEQHLTGSKRLMSYIIKTQKRVLVHLQPFKYYDSKDYLRLDNNAVRNLELVESLKGNKSKNNLFSILDKCSTAMGSRFLKKSLMYPLVDLKKITQRHDLIDDFTKHFIVVEDIKKDLMEIYDLERIVGRISYGSLSPKDLIQLKHSIGVLPSIKQKLSKINTKESLKKSDEIITFESLYDVNKKHDVCIKLFEGISLDGKYIPEKTKKNNLTGKENLIESKIKPKFNITRSYCEKLNNQ